MAKTKTRLTSSKIQVKKKDLARVFADVVKGLQNGDFAHSEGRRRIEDAAEHDETVQRGRNKGYDPHERHDGSRWADPNDAERRGGKRRGKVTQQSVQKAHNRLITTPPTSEEIGFVCSDEDIRMRKRMQDLHDGFVFCGFHRKGYVAEESEYYAEYKYLSQKLTEKILTTQSGGSGSGTGGDFIPNTLSGQLTELFRLQTLVSNLLPHINMTDSPMKLPLEGADSNAYLISEGSDNNVGSHSADAISVRDASTSKSTLTAITLGVRGMISRDSSEDAIIDTVGYTRNKLVTIVANGWEDALINGDTSSTHQDSDVTASTDPRKAFDGFRFLTNAEAAYDKSQGKLTSTSLLNVIVKMGKFSTNPSDTMIIVSPIGLAHLVADSNMMTVDKLGARATLLNGQVGSVLGRPVIVSGFVRNDLNAAGVYDNSVTDRTMAVMVHRPSFLVGDRRAVTVEADFDIIAQKHVVVVTMRGDFIRVQAEASGERNVGYVYNVDTTATF